MANSELTPELLETMKQELLGRRAGLNKKVRKELDQMSNKEGHHLADMADQGADANDEERSFGLLEIGSAELAQVEAALDLIAAGTYGVCGECQTAIGLERLKARPFSTKCIKCKRVEESGDLIDPYR